LADNTPPWNIATGIVLLLGRFPALIFPLAIAGFLSAKKRVPQTSGTLRTDNLTFAGMLLGTVLLWAHCRSCPPWCLARWLTT
jgi:K+-transporting ATPase ATPase A chain